MPSIKSTFVARLQTKRVIVEGLRVTFEKTFFGFVYHRDVFFKEEISGVITKRSVYDIPFFEKTVIIRMRDGRKIKVNQLPSKQAETLFELLTQK